MTGTVGLVRNDVQIIRPALFFLSSSFRRSSIFSSNFLPAYLRSSTETFSLGREGCSSPQTRSTRFSLIPTSEAPPFFLIFSASLRASAGTSKMTVQPRRYPSSLRAVMSLGSTPTEWLPSDCSAVLDTLSVPIDCQDNSKHHSCQVGTSSRPCFNRCQLLSSCLDA